jgi:hypothetical protein
VAHGREDDLGGIAGTAFEIAAAVLAPHGYRAVKADEIE